MVINMKELYENYKELTKLAKVSLEFQFIKEDSIYGNTRERQNQMISIIKNTPSFNEKDNKQIANTFLDFYNSLPKLYLNEGNPNNGAYLFQSVKLIGDDTIILETYHNVNSETLNIIAEMVNEYGRKINADEHSVEINKITDTFSYTRIKFWWD